jgi:hypothetical protein
MVARRHWAAVIALGGIVSGCGEPTGKTITPKNLGPPSEAQIKKIQEMMGGTMAVAKQAEKMKRAPGPIPGGTVGTKGTTPPK